MTILTTHKHLKSTNPETTQRLGLKGPLFKSYSDRILWHNLSEYSNWFHSKAFFLFQTAFLLLFATFHLLDWYCNVLKGLQYFLMSPCMIMQFVSWHLKKHFEGSLNAGWLIAGSPAPNATDFKPGFCHSVTLWMQVGGAAQFKAGFCDWRDTRCSVCFSSVLCFFFSVCFSENLPSCCRFPGTKRCSQVIFIHHALQICIYRFVHLFIRVSCIILLLEFSFPSIIWGVEERQEQVGVELVWFPDWHEGGVRSPDPLPKWVREPDKGRMRRNVEVKSEVGIRGAIK